MVGVVSMEYFQLGEVHLVAWSLLSDLDKFVLRDAECGVGCSSGVIAGWRCIAGCCRGGFGGVVIGGWRWCCRGGLVGVVVTCCRGGFLVLTGACGWS